MEVTLLKAKEIWGNGALQVLEDYGKKSGASDLAVILGALLSGYGWTSENAAAGYWWSASQGSTVSVRAVDNYGDKDWSIPDLRRIAARPALPSSATSLIRPSLTRAIDLLNGNKVEVWEYGEYPQTVATDRVSAELEKQYRQNQLSHTCKKYTFDSADLEDYETGFQGHSYEEYQYQGKRYIRIEGRPADNDSIMSNGQQVVGGQFYWVEVEPIVWLKDRSGVLVSKELLFAGVQFDTHQTYDGDFDKTFMHQYLRDYFAKEAGLNNE